MQMKPYQSQELSPTGGDRIHVPGSSALGLAAPGNQPPSLAAVFGEGDLEAQDNFGHLGHRHGRCCAAPSS